MKESERTELIKIISDASDRSGDKLIKFLDEYNLDGLEEASINQLQEFIIKEKDEKI